MNTNEIKAYAIAALLQLAGENMGIHPDKTYKIQANFKFVMKNGKVESLDVKRIHLREK